MAVLSVIVPCYKVEKYLRRCADTLVKQTLTDIEIIFIDDGSPDSSGDICDEYAKQDNRIKVVHKNNEGVSAARNDGLKIATGEYVIFVDSDDYLPLDAFQIMYDKAKETGADIVAGDIFEVIDGENYYRSLYSKPFFTNDSELLQELTSTVLYKEYCPFPPDGGAQTGYAGPCNKIVRRSIIVENYISFDLRVKGVFDDIIYSAYILSVANSYAYVNKPVYYYRIVKGSITQSYKQNMPEICQAIQVSMLEFVEKNDHVNCYRNSYYSFLIALLAYSMPRYYCNKQNPSSIKENSNKIRKLVSSHEYQEAIRNVDASILTKSQKILYFLLKTKQFSLAIILYKMRRF